MDKKKLALIIGFILITLLLGVGLYYLFFKQPAVIAPGGVAEEKLTPRGAGALPSAGFGGAPGATSQGGVPSGAPELPSAAQVPQGGVVKTTALTQNPVLSPHIAGSQIAYYDRTDGKFYRVNANGDTIALSNQTFYNVERVTWNPQSDKAVLEYPDGSKIAYDFGTQKQATLPKHWTDFSFNPNGNKLAAKSIGLDPENRFLVAANADGTDAQTITALGDNADKVQVSWSPNNQIIGFSATGDARGFASKEILPIGFNKENFKPIIVPGMDFNPLWSKNGDRLLFSTYNPGSSYKPELWIVGAQGDAIGSGRTPIKINTWANKCAFADNATVFCAVPNNLPDGAGFEPEIANSIPDTLYKIDLNTGTQTPVVIPEQEMTINSLVVSSAKDALYFTDANSGILHTIKLK